MHAYSVPERLTPFSWMVTPSAWMLVPETWSAGAEPTEAGACGAAVDAVWSAAAKATVAATVIDHAPVGFLTRILRLLPRDVAAIIIGR
jgi:hypothetical protein